MVFASADKYLCASSQIQTVPSVATIVLGTTKLSSAATCVRWLKADETDVPRTIYVLVLRELN
jgi:hypothetical protein